MKENTLPNYLVEDLKKSFFSKILSDSKLSKDDIKDELVLKYMIEQMKEKIMEDAFDLFNFSVSPLHQILLDNPKVKENLEYQKENYNSVLQNLLDKLRNTKTSDYNNVFNEFIENVENMDFKEIDLFCFSNMFIYVRNFAENKVLFNFLEVAVNKKIIDSLLLNEPIEKKLSIEKFFSIRFSPHFILYKFGNKDLIEQYFFNTLLPIDLIKESIPYQKKEAIKIAREFGFDYKELSEIIFPQIEKHIENAIIVNEKKFLDSNTENNQKNNSLDFKKFKI